MGRIKNWLSDSESVCSTASRSSPATCDHGINHQTQQSSWEVPSDDVVTPERSTERSMPRPSSGASSGAPSGAPSRDTAESLGAGQSGDPMLGLSNSAADGQQHVVHLSRGGYVELRLAQILEDGMVRHHAAASSGGRYGQGLQATRVAYGNRGSMSPEGSGYRPCNASGAYGRTGGSKQNQGGLDVRDAGGQGGSSRYDRHYKGYHDDYRNQYLQHETTGLITLRGLRLSDYELPMDWNFLKHWAKAANLDLAQNFLTGRGLAWVIERIAHFPHLRIVNLNSNNIGDSAADPLVKLCRHSPALCEVHLSHNRISWAGADQIVQAACKRQILKDLEGREPALWVCLEQNIVKDAKQLFSGWQARGLLVSLYSKTDLRSISPLGVILPLFLSQREEGHYDDDYSREEGFWRWRPTSGKESTSQRTNGSWSWQSDEVDGATSGKESTSQRASRSWSWQSDEVDGAGEACRDAEWKWDGEANRNQNIWPHDIVQWMWGDVTCMGGPNSKRGHVLAQQNALRWSHWNRLDAAIADLTKCRSVKNTNRAVEVRTQREMVILNFGSPDEAIAALQKASHDGGREPWTGPLEKDEPPSRFNDERHVDAKAADVTLAFYPGELGLTLDEVGKIVQLKSGQALMKGIQIDMFVTEVDGRPFSHERLFEKVRGTEKYKVTFATVASAPPAGALNTNILQQSSVLDSHKAAVDTLPESTSLPSPEGPPRCVVKTTSQEFVEGEDDRAIVLGKRSSSLPVRTARDMDAANSDSMGDTVESVGFVASQNAFHATDSAQQQPVEVPPEHRVKRGEELLRTLEEQPPSPVSLGRGTPSCWSSQSDSYSDQGSAHNKNHQCLLLQVGSHFEPCALP